MEEFGIKYIPDQPDSYRKWIKIPKILIRKVLVTCPISQGMQLKKLSKVFLRFVLFQQGLRIVIFHAARQHPYNTLRDKLCLFVDSGFYSIL